MSKIYVGDATTNVKVGGLTGWSVADPQSILTITLGNPMTCNKVEKEYWVVGFKVTVIDVRKDQGDKPASRVLYESPVLSSVVEGYYTNKVDDKLVMLQEGGNISAALAKAGVSADMVELNIQEVWRYKAKE